MIRLQNRLFSILFVLFFCGILSGITFAAGEFVKNDGIGGTGSPVMRDGIGGTGSPAMQDGIGGTGAPQNGIGGTGAPVINNGIGGTGQRLAEVAGRVLFIAGQVQVQHQGENRQLAKGDVVRAGDTLDSGIGASLQLRMEDGGTIILRPESRLEIESFAFNQLDAGRGYMALALINGGFRAVTGSIGHLHKENYRIRTPNATIGILGTDHETVFVPVPKSGQTTVVVPGTYDHVISGATMLKNEQGSLLIKPNQTGFAALKGAAPVMIDRALQIFGDRMSHSKEHAEQNGDIDTHEQRHSDVNGSRHEDNSSGNMKQAADTTGQNTQQDSITQINRLGNTNLDLNTLETDGEPAAPGSAVTGANLSASMLNVGCVSAGNPSQTLLAENDLPGSYANNVSGFNFVAGENDPLNEGKVQVDGAAVNWGIYTGGISFDTSGKAFAINFHPFAYVSGGAPVVTSVMSGSATFSSIAGYTQPVNELGNIGGSVNLAATVNLGASTITSYNLTVTDAGSRNWTGNLVNGAPVALATFANGTPLTVTCSNCGPGVLNGSAAGLLVGANAKGLISSYVLSSTTGQAAAGVVVLSRP
jgi:hypothetical protein